MTRYQCQMCSSHSNEPQCRVCLSMNVVVISEDAFWPVEPLTCSNEWGGPHDATAARRTDRARPPEGEAAAVLDLLTLRGSRRRQRTTPCARR